MRSSSAPGIIRSISQCGSLEECRRLHQFLIAEELHSGRFVGNLLLQMYGRFGSVEEAAGAFNGIAQGRNVVSWNILLRAFAQNGHFREAETLYFRMPARDLVSWNTMLQAYAQNGHLYEMKKLFGDMQQRDVITWTCLITAYAQTGHTHLVLEVFEKMPQQGVVACNASIPCYNDSRSAWDAFERMPTRDCVTWNAMIQKFSVEADNTAAAAKSLYERMPQHNVVTWTSILAALGGKGYLDEARLVFLNMEQRCPACWNALVVAFARNSCFEGARIAFEKMPAHNILSWNAMVNAYAQNGHLLEAFNLFEAAPQRNHVSWTAMITACAQAGNLALAEIVVKRIPQRNRITWNAIITARAKTSSYSAVTELFEQIPEKDIVPWNEMLQVAASDLHSVKAHVEHEMMEAAKSLFDRASACGIVQGSVLGNTMILGYAGTRCIQHAKQIFHDMEERDIVTWNSMIQAYIRSSTSSDETGNENENASENDAKSSRLQNAKSCFYRMPYWDVVSWAVMMSVYAEEKLVEDAKKLFDKVPELDLVMWTSMVTVYVQNGLLEAAQSVFDAMPGWDMPSVTAIMQGYAQAGHIEEAERLLDLLPHPDAFSSTVMITAYGQQQRLEDALRVFQRMREPSVVTWNALLGAFVENGCEEEALKLFLIMDMEGTTPNAATYVTVMDACASSASLLCFGKTIHSVALAEGLLQSHAGVGAALIGLYGRCGLVDEASEAFLQIGMKNLDKSSWNAMVLTFAWNGEPALACEILQLMLVEGFAPDPSTFLAMLTAFSHAGLLIKAWSCFHSMVADHLIEPRVSHYLCIVDLLARCGELQQAEELIQSMPYESEEITWTTLLGACKTHGDASRGVSAAHNLIKMDPERGATYKLLSSSIQAALGFS